MQTDLGPCPRPACGTNATKGGFPCKTKSFLAGKLYDDRGNRMGPSHAAKAGRRWRYYVSRALLKGRKSDAGLVTRVPGAQIEKQVLDATKSVIPTRRTSEGLVTLSHVALSGKTAGSHLT
jgi:hypothetical protein